MKIRLPDHSLKDDTRIFRLFRARHLAGPRIDNVRQLPFTRPMGAKASQHFRIEQEAPRMPTTTAGVVPVTTLGYRPRSLRYVPCEASGAALVACCVLGLDRERVAAQAKPRVALRA